MDPAEPPQALQEAPEDEDALDWRRSHPLTILVEIGEAIWSVLAVVVVGGGLFEVGNLIETAVGGLLLLGALARWYTARYALGQHSVYHQRGLLFRRKQVLPRTSIQNLSTKAGLVARMGSLVELQISDASARGDIKIRLISTAEAERLTALLRASMAPSDDQPEDGTLDPHGPAPIGGTPVDTPPLARPGMKDLVRTELTASGALGMLILMVGTMAPILMIAPLVTRRFAGDDVLGTRGWSLLGLTTAAPVALALVAALLTRVVALGQFHLHADPDRLRIRTGLLTEARVATRRPRIQWVRADRDLLHRRLGIERIRFDTADVDVQFPMATRYLSPTEPTGRWRELATEAIGPLQLDEADLEPVSPLTRRRVLARFALGAVVLGVPLAVVHPALTLGVGAAALVVGRWYARRRFALLGGALGPDQLLLRVGVVDQHLTLVRLDKVQSVRISASWFQRRLGLATVAVSTAGLSRHQMALPDLPLERAVALHDRLAHRAAVTPLADTL